ncbi:MAG: hypothetical protein AAB250_17040 [Bdellovibrionota bacterium]
MASRAGTVWTLVGSFVFCGLIAVMLGASTAHTETNESKALVCTASFFFSFDRFEVIGDTARVNGRGLLSCKNDEGFSLEEPVIGDLEVKVKGGLPEGEIALSGNTSTFVIPREPTQLQDLYRTRDFAWTAKSAGGEQRLVFRGVTNDLVIDMRLTSNNAPNVEFEVETLRLRYDDAAPNLNGY